MTQRTRFMDLLSHSTPARVLCIGDIMLDRFVYGSVDRISPEAPIPVLKITREDEMLGGAGNVMRNLHALGAQACFAGLVGEDEAAGKIHELLNAANGMEAVLIRDKTRTTTLKTRYMASNQQIMRADYEEAHPISSEQEKSLFSEISKKIAHYDVVVLSDYGKGVLSDGLCRQIITLATQMQKPVIVDPKGADYEKYRGARLVTPNLKELSEASRMSCQSDDDILAAARHVIDQSGVENILATRSKDGMSLISASQQVLHLPTRARDVFDVSGAGDTVVATMALAIALGASQQEGAELANLAAGLVVAKIGTAAVYREELLQALMHEDVSRAEDKILTKQSAVDKINLWKSQNISIGFTNGCFDLLHPGHISLLKQAKAQCDKLVIGLNSDASVSRLKGPSRPVQNELARATVLSSLESVDLVVIFDEDTPYQLLESLLPDVLVKGADYTREQVVGGDLIEQNGGRVFLAQLEDGFSTTRTVQKMTGKT